MSTNAQIEVTVNGQNRSVSSSLTIHELLASLEIEPARVAVELDRRIVKPRDWDTTSIQNGSQIEIVQFVGGG